jgi:hypothetical protein
MIAMLNSSPPQLGIFDRVPRAVYEAWPAINHSKLKLMVHPPALARHMMDFPPEPSDALDLGHAAHVAILEPERLTTDFVSAPDIDRRSKEGKLAWKEFQEEQEGQGRLILPADDYQLCLNLRDGLWARDSVAKAILQSPGRNERSFGWMDAESGLACKARLDAMRRWDGWTMVVDVKTARSASAADFARDIAKYHYHTQAAFYLDGLTALADVPRRWLWLVLEKRPPFLHALYEPEDRLLEQGRRTYREWLAAYKLATETDTWPGYPNGIVPIDVPRWAMDFTNFEPA